MTIIITFMFTFYFFLFLYFIISVFSMQNLVIHSHATSKLGNACEPISVMEIVEIVVRVQVLWESN
jgi:hypothetical protein